MAIGRSYDRRAAIMRAPKRGPQSFLTGLLARDVGDVTLRTRRVPELVVNAGVYSRTYFAPYRPGTAQRIPPLLGTGYGADYATDERVRTTLVARSRLFKSATQVQPANQQANAARAQAVNAAGQPQ